MSTPDLDTGARLRAQYVNDGGSAAVFSQKVAAYAASRPDYPPKPFDALQSIGELSADKIVADIGAGTGLLTRALVARADKVIAIEPSDDMRAACDASLAGHDRYRSPRGTAEQTSLDDASVDLLTAVQAFHWFDIDAARQEFLRVRPTGQVALIWNDRVRTDPLHVAMDEVFATYGGAKRGAMLAHENRSDVPRFFGGATVHEIDLPHEHRLDRG
jgi:SAM-dependent methyltransferase